MKTSELTGAALDWAVCVAEGEKREAWLSNPYSYSTNWIFGGPIIEREGISVDRCGKAWTADIANQIDGYIEHTTDGPTPLISAMRCYVASKLGDEIEIPKELL